MQTKATTIRRLKAGPDDDLAEGEFIVYPSTFTRTPDAYGEVVAPGAFTDWMADHRKSGAVLPGLFGHRLDDPDYFVAEAIDMGEDEHGWWVKGRFDLDSPKGKQVYRLVKGRRVTQLSFAFDVLDAAPVEIDGESVYELRKLKVYEFSFVPVGANQDTSVVAVKAIADALKSDFESGRELGEKTAAALRAAKEAIEQVLGDLDKTPEQASESGPSAKEQASQEPPVTPNLDLDEAEFQFIPTPKEEVDEAL